MANFQYASFPNSRNRFRTATVNSNTDRLTIGNLTQPITLIRPSNPNRTYLILSNLDPGTSLLYLYAITASVNPSAVPRNGVEGQLLWNPTTNLLYQKQDSGLNTNWIVVDPIDVAEEIFPYQNATLESLGDVYGVANAGAGSILIAYDEGRG